MPPSLSGFLIGLCSGLFPIFGNGNKQSLGFFGFTVRERSQCLIAVRSGLLLQGFNSFSQIVPFPLGVELVFLFSHQSVENGFRGR